MWHLRPWTISNGIWRLLFYDARSLFVTAVLIVLLCGASDARALCYESTTPPINICVYSDITTDSWRYDRSYAVRPGGGIIFPLYVQNKGNNDIGVVMRVLIFTHTDSEMAKQVVIKYRKVHAGQARVFNAGLTTRPCFSGVSCSLAPTWVLDIPGEGHLSTAVEGLAGTDGRPAYPLPYGEYRISLSFGFGVFGTNPSFDWVHLAAGQGGNYYPLYVVSSIHQRTISRHNTAMLTNAEADSILSDASTVLVVNDGQDDVACPAALVRWGDVGTLSITDGSIDTRAELKAVEDAPGNVKVVGAVNCCGKVFDPQTGDIIIDPITGLPQCKFNTTYDGCGQQPGTSFIIKRTINEGILWAHEFGHNQGLDHRNDSPNNVMNWLSLATSRRINQEECNAFLAQRAQTATTEAITRTQTSTLGGEPLPVEEFVSKSYLHGLPLAQAATYGEKDVETLLRMLNDPSLVQYRENIAVTLGMIGSERAVDPLISYINLGAAAEDTISRPTYNGRVGALVALGYLVNLTGNQKALSYLLESTSPAIWLQRNVDVTEKTMRDFSKYAIISLGLSGHPTAVAHLRSLRDQESAVDDRSFRTEIEDILNQSLQISEYVSRNGLLKYYEEDAH